MDWLERLNQAINYMEENLSGEISYDHAAQIACCSTFHFQRMFSYIAGIPLGEYIRRRRMTEAAFDLQQNGLKVIDAALKYGYDSPTAFNRAFQGVHGVSPAGSRSEGVSLKAYPRISFKISIRGDAEMNYRIETKEAFRIVGVKRGYTSDVEDNFKKIPMFWQETHQAGIIPKLCALMDCPPFGVLGVCACMVGNEFDYFISVASDKPVPEGMDEYEVPANTWAIFECVGAMPKAIQELQTRIVSEWLPSSGYEYADAPDIEIYSEGDMSSPDYRSEVWLPVTKKK
ncbi:MAG: AraC family transcriptional regulator [Firmicutes bacterium HGW-Firmicutes-16]|nr:MAG: AraC family transcriptional regulator [Firmicutes bacterium HGW-Firmicutes-16]